MDLDEAIAYLEQQGFKATRHRFGPKVRVDLSWPDDRRGERLPEWRVIEIAENWRQGRQTVRSDPRGGPYRRY